MADEIPGACGAWGAKISTHIQRAKCPRSAGVYQLVRMNQNEPRDVIISGWSRSVSVTGTPGANYSLYIDVKFTDGSYSYGHYVAFDVGYDGWQYKAVAIVNVKPIATMYVHALFRGNHTGVVYFDNISVREGTVNLIFNPSFDRASSECTSRMTIPGWSNENPAIPYMVCPLPEPSLIHTPPGYVMTPGDHEVSGLHQRVLLRQRVMRNLTLSVWCKWTSPPHAGILASKEMKMIITNIDGTQEYTSLDIPITTDYKQYSLDFTPLKPIDFVDVHFTFNGKGYGFVYWDDASLIQH